ncbi:hypothetical protein PRK78_000651 [Emydomyces testavorans]|uniref:Uncharacterized protein n=1 Tax=Emydomyces testavorans TaxID=2070801 RepID=A0AAF0DCW7_9EURO|nr:hypothetical protein PRK78_000651 [Emydomyces testavorans]
MNNTNSPYRVSLNLKARAGNSLNQTSIQHTGYIDSSRTGREVTVQALWKRLQEFSVVHVRGTPASGKSTLARLLQLHVQNTSNIRVISFTWPMNFPAPLSVRSPYYYLLNHVLGRPLDTDDWLEQRVLLIIDEAQGSYPYTSLWNDLIKILSSDYCIRVALFSSYGSPSSRPLEAQTPTPVIFDPKQRVSLWRTPANPDIGLFFSQQEYDDVVKRVARHHGEHGPLFRLSRDLQDYIWEITSGHASAVRVFLDCLASSDAFHEFRRRSAEIPLSAAWERLSDDSFVINCIENSAVHGLARGLPRKQFLQDNPEIAQFLRDAVATHGSNDNPDSNSALKTCYQMGWLQAELLTDDKPTYIFPTAIHRSRRGCRDRMGFVLNTRPLELTYQDEFYRYCYSLLGNQLYLASEWTGTKKGGRANFQVRGTHWAIEILRDGENIEEHVARFKPGGRYYQWLQAQGIHDYAILDFGRTQPQSQWEDEHLYFVVCSEDYTYRLYDGKLSLLDDEVALLD